MLDLQQLAQKLEDWDDEEWHYWPFVMEYLGVSRRVMKAAIKFQRMNPDLFNHVLVADSQGFYKRVDRGRDLKRYLAYRDKWVNSHHKMLNAVGVRDLNTSDPNSIEGQLAIYIQKCRMESVEAYENALRLPAILAQHSHEEQMVIMRAITSK